MLNHTFFTIETMTRESQEPGQEGQLHEKCHAGVRINPGHSIFEGHFPGNPVIPGVCQVQMVTEILGEFYTRRFRLAEADNIKFLSLINPLETGMISLDLTCRQLPAGEVSVNAVAFTGGLTYLKMKARFIPEPEG